MSKYNCETCSYKNVCLFTCIAKQKKRKKMAEKIGRWTGYSLVYIITLCTDTPFLAFFIK